MLKYEKLQPLLIGFLSGWLFAIYVIESFAPKGELAMFRQAVNECHSVVNNYQERLVAMTGIKPKKDKKQTGVGGG